MTGAVDIIGAVARTSQINMMDRLTVIDKCRQLGYIDIAKWISENPRSYAKMIIEEAIAPYLTPQTESD